jgi:hypothetical protein
MMKATTPIEVTCLVGRFIPDVSLEMTPQTAGAGGVR